MATQCYELVRGSSLRVTQLDRRGRVPSPFRFVVSKAVSRVTVEEVAEATSNDYMRNDDDKARILITTPGQLIRNRIGIEFLRVDPEILSFVTGAPVVTNAAGDVVGFDFRTKQPPVAFALEVWTRLAARCADGSLQWGYTLFPFLKGGTLSGFSFANGLVSFNLERAQTRRYSRWGTGPYDLSGEPGTRLPGVSRNGQWRQTLVTGAPPAQTDGAVEMTDIIDGGTATLTTSDILDGGTAVAAGPYVVDGGGA